MYDTEQSVKLWRIIENSFHDRSKYGKIIEWTDDGKIFTITDLNTLFKQWLPDPKSYKPSQLKTKSLVQFTKSECELLKELDKDQGKYQ